MGDRPERDEERFAWLERMGYAVLRIPASDVMKDVEGTAEAIIAMCQGSGA